MPLGDELLENFNTRALPQSGRGMAPEEKTAKVEQALTEEGNEMDITKKWTGRRKDRGTIHSQLKVFFEGRI